MKILSLFFYIAGFNALSPACLPVFKPETRTVHASHNRVSHSAPTDDSTQLKRPASTEEWALAARYAEDNGYSTDYIFLIDMRIASGKNRFFVYSTKGDSIELSGLVAHGSCNTHHLEEPVFSNKPNCGCSSVGKYKVGGAYQGEFGKSYRLYGLDSSNSNAFKRGIVLHGFDPVPDHEIYPEALCNSYGCPMVNRAFLSKVSAIIDKSKKPILMWIYE